MKAKRNNVANKNKEMLTPT